MIQIVDNLQQFNVTIIKAVTENNFWEIQCFYKYKYCI